MIIAFWICTAVYEATLLVASSGINTPTIMFLNTDTFPLFLSFIPAGRYRLTTRMKIKGHHYKDILTFNINNKPDFRLAEMRPLIFSSNVDNLTSGIEFAFKYDNSYQFKGRDLIYTGVVIRIEFNDTPDIRTGYLVQDFQAQDTKAWLLGTETLPGTVDWEPVLPDNAGLLTMVFSGLESSTEIQYDFKLFYFRDTLSDNEQYTNLPEETLTENYSGEGVYYRE